MHDHTDQTDDEIPTFRLDPRHFAIGSTIALAPIALHATLSSGPNRAYAVIAMGIVAFFLWDSGPSRRSGTTGRQSRMGAPELRPDLLFGCWFLFRIGRVISEDGATLAGIVGVAGFGLLAVTFLLRFYGGIPYLGFAGRRSTLPDS